MDSFLTLVPPPNSLLSSMQGKLIAQTIPTALRMVSDAPRNPGHTGHQGSASLERQRANTGAPSPLQPAAHAGRFPPQRYRASGSHGTSLRGSAQQEPCDEIASKDTRYKQEMSLRLTSLEPLPKPLMTLPSICSGKGGSGPASEPTMSGRVFPMILVAFSPPPVEYPGRGPT